MPENKEEEEEKEDAAKKKKNGKVFAWNGTLHVFYENELKKWLFFLFLNLYSLFRIFLIIFSFFSIEWILFRAIFSLFFRVQIEINCIPSHRSREAFTNENWQVLKNTQNEHAHTYIHYWKSFFLSYTQIAFACNELNIQRNLLLIWRMPKELFLSPFGCRKILRKYF